MLVLVEGIKKKYCSLTHSRSQPIERRKKLTGNKKEQTSNEIDSCTAPLHTLSPRNPCTKGVTKFSFTWDAWETTHQEWKRKS